VRVPIVRPDLDSIPDYQPGRQASSAALEAAGVAQLSSNEAPWAPGSLVRDDVSTALAILNRYPSMSSADLRGALATKFGVTIDQVVVGAGGVEVARQAAAASVRPGGEVVYATPSFPDYEIMTRINGGIPVPVPLRGPAHDLEAMVAVITERTRMLVICNPNNPTGTGLPTDEIRAILPSVPRDVLVLVDEAYFEFTAGELGESAVSLVANHPNVVVLRTFSKAYGLAAVRVGYGFASPEVASAMRKCQLPFSVNGLAEVAALAALASEKHMQSGVVDVITERRRVADRLTKLGFDVAPSHGNFLWIDGTPGQEIVRQCEAAKIAVRPLGPLGGRVTIGSPDDNERVLAACAAAASVLGLPALSVT
jgi:histidinol-phosphate aminotransferase